jgi:hypothetical protein
VFDAAAEFDPYSFLPAWSRTGANADAASGGAGPPA